MHGGFLNWFAPRKSVQLKSVASGRVTRGRSHEKVKEPDVLACLQIVVPPR